MAGMRPMRAWVIIRVWRVRRVSERMAQIQTNATAMPPPAMGMTFISSVDLCDVLVWICCDGRSIKTYQRFDPSGLVRDFKNRLKY